METAVGEVHRSNVAEEVAESRSQKVGEVHADRSQLRQWQEDGVEVYSMSQAAPSVSSFASEAKEALHSLGVHPVKGMKGITGFSVLWVLLLVVISMTSMAAMLYWGPWKLDEQGPQWLPEALSQDLVAREAKDTKAAKAPELEEGDCPAHAEPKSELGSREQQQEQDQQVQDRFEQLVREAAVCGEANLEQVLPSAAGYDCALSKPVSSGRPVKLLCRIEGPLPGGPPPLGLLRAPLSQRSCVCFTAVAEGAAPRKAAEGVDFQVSLVGAPWIRIDVQGHEVKLLDTPENAYTPYQAFGDLPKHWKNFVSPERDSKLFGLPQSLQPPQPPASAHLEGQPFRFREARRGIVQI